ncbi:DoxX family protein [Pontibacter qinzhouensis]|uniref:DoxX family protein n=1 Tax=Pontibacter qinzhouensis TaxID=2603253 RepID=A0A5C8K9G2_9BACT|nr:DoxX family protein [Pontibacter qinzhouensis]TXK45765.1 DoxX family protein [Pontibacter qinzhouensis]
MSFLRAQYNHTDTGLLLLRLGIGFMFILHGWPKMAGGPDMWEQIGKNMELIGIGFLPTFWGFMASAAETIGGAFLMLGLLHRPTCILLAITMVIATIRHIAAGDGFGGYSHALEAAILFSSLYFIGPGKYSLDETILPTRKDRSVF